MIIVAFPIYTEKLYFYENCHHGRNPNKDSKIRHHKKNCNHGRSPIKTQKHVSIKRTTIIVAVLIKRTVIIVAVL